MSEGVSDLNDLFNPRDVRATMVDCITYSGNGGKDGLIRSSIFRERDGCLGSSEWCANGGTSMLRNDAWTLTIRL